MIKKIVCAALMLALLATSSMGAFAAVTATTTYDGTDITVTSEVDGVAVGDTITYIAYDAGEAGTDVPADGNIAYIDQIKVENGDENLEGDVYTIIYKADPKYVGAKVLQGGIGFDSVSDTTIQDYKEYCVIKVGGTEAAKIERLAANAKGYVEVKVAALATAATITANGAPVDDWYPTADGAAIAASIFSVAEVDLAYTAASTQAAITLDAVKGFKDAKIAIATVTGDTSDYGVILSDTNAPSATVMVGNDDAAYDAAKAYMFKALDKGDDGKFMIRVNGEFDVDDTFYAKGYVNNAGVGEFLEVVVVDDTVGAEE